MSDAEVHPLSRILEMVDLWPDERIDFSDAGAPVPQVTHLTVSAMYLNVVSVIEFGGRGGAIRQKGLVEQIVASAFQTFGGYNPHPGAFEKAATMLRGITQGHPFEDGNKRTGFLTAMLYLDLRGFPLPVHVSVDEIIDLCYQISAGNIRDVDEIARELQRLWGQG